MVTPGDPCERCGQDPSWCPCRSEDEKHREAFDLANPHLVEPPKLFDDEEYEYLRSEDDDEDV